MRHFSSVAAVFVCALTLTSCSRLALNEEQIRMEVIKGNRIVEAIDTYKKSENNLPDTLDELISLDLLRPSDIESSIMVSGEPVVFNYRRILSLENLEYVIWLELDRPIYFLLEFPVHTQLIFYSDGLYEVNPMASVDKRVGRWAILTFDY